ncbi:MAG: PEP-CTERM sorting domain-containing protein [Armatimonadota bacterium]
MAKRSMLCAVLALTVLTAGASFGNSFGITIGKETRDGLDQLVFDNVAGDIQYAVGSYKYTKVNGVWSAANAPASPGLGYNDIHRQFDAMALFFRPELNNARFLIVTGMPQSGVLATNIGYGNRRFGPGDLKIEVGPINYGVGLRQGGLYWGTVDPGPSQPWYQVHKAEGGTDIISARDAGTLGMVKKNPQWDHVDNHTLAPYSENAYAFFRADSGAPMPGSAAVNFFDTGIALQGFPVFAYEVTVPWSSLEINPQQYAFRASWRPDCGNDIIAADFSGHYEVPPPDVPEAPTLLLALSGLSAIGIARRRR